VTIIESNHARRNGVVRARGRIDARRGRQRTLTFVWSFQRKYHCYTIFSVAILYLYL